MYKIGMSPLAGGVAILKDKRMQGVIKDEKHYTATQARKEFADIVDAAYFGERVVIQKRDRQVALVSMAFLERVDKLLEAEAAIEAELANSALQEFQLLGGKTMDELEKDLDMG